MSEQDLFFQEQASRYVYSIGRWYRFFAILFIVGIVLMALMALMMIVLGGTIGAQMASLGVSPIGMGMPPVILGLIYLACAGIYVPLVIFLNRGAKSAKTAATTGEMSATVEFLANTKKFWKCYGIITIIVIGLCVLILPLSILFGMMSAL